MSKNKNNRRLVESFNGFGGLDVTSPIGSGKLVTFKNFKLLPDGSAIKRRGFRHFCGVWGEQRGEVVCSDGGDEIILAVIGSSLVRISIPDGEITSAQVFESDEGSIKFFEHLGELYILDGYRLYRYLGGCDAVICEPYIPLYGNEWKADVLAGSVNEPMSALTPKIRITYRATGSRVYTLDVGLKIKSVEGIWGNGELVPAGYYKIDSDRTRITFYEYYFSGTLCVYLTVDGDVYRDSGFESCDRCDVFDSFEDSRIFAYGGEDKSRIYASVPVSESDVREQSRLYGRIEPVYFPSGEPVVFSMTDEITAMSRIYDRMLIFSKFRTWFTSSLKTNDGHGRRGLLLNSALESTGCPSRDGVSLINGDNIITVSYGGAYRWTADDEFEEEIRLTRISDNVNPVFDKAFINNALVCRNRGENELWFGDASSEEGRVLVYNCDGKNWYLYDGINADRFFEVGDTVVFRRGTDYYIFDGDDGYDTFENGERNIEAVIESADFDFSQPSERKHLDRVTVTCELDGGEMLVEIGGNQLLFSRTLKEEDASEVHGDVDFFDMRTRTGRIESADFRLSVSDKRRQRVYSVAFFAG